jgi:hypothetical protein
MKFGIPYVLEDSYEMDGGKAWGSSLTPEKVTTHIPKTLGEAVGIRTTELRMSETQVLKYKMIQKLEAIAATMQQDWEDFSIYPGQALSMNRVAMRQIEIKSLIAELKE